AEEVTVEKVDLGKLIETVRAARSPKATFQAPAKPVVIDADPRRLERIIANFLDNAHEHADDKDVQIEVDPSPEDEIVIPVTDRGTAAPANTPKMISDR